MKLAFYSNFILKGALFFVLISFSFDKVQATDYYFSSSSGSDEYSFEQAQSNLSPWKSINKLNEISSNLRGGDRIFFKRGDVFYGTLRLLKGGTIDGQIFFDAYGKGNMPIITSLVKVDSWENLGNGIYKSIISNIESSNLKIVLIDNEIKGFGRYPNVDEVNGGYLTIQSVNNEFSINGPLIPFNGKGGEIVIRKNNWIIDAHPISNSIGGKIDFIKTEKSSYNPLQGFGYFIQNHIDALDQPGEWAYSKEEKTLTVYFGEKNPSDIQIEYAANDYLLVTNYLVGNLSFKNIQFKGSNKNIVNIERSSNILLENCVLEYAGENAVYSYSTSDFSVLNNKIQNALSGAIFFWHSTPRAIIADNVIENSMPFQGMAKNSDLKGIGIYISGNADDSKILRNRIINSGYNGIHFGGNNSIVMNNLVENFCLWKQDGGGIYMNSDRLVNKNNIGRKIIGNIVIGGVGAKEGTDQDFDLAEGIYLDDNTEGVLITQNTVAHINGKGIYLHNASNIQITNNLFYDCSTQLKLNHDTLGRPLRNIIVEENQFSIISEGEIAFSISSIKNDLNQFGSSRRNYFLDPYRKGYFFENKGPDDIGYSKKRNFEDWFEMFGLEESSKIEVTDLNRFEVLNEKILKQSNFSKDITLVSGVYNADSKNITLGTAGGVWEITPNTDKSALAYVQIGAVTKGDKISVEFDVKSRKGNQDIEVFLENSFNLNQADAISYLNSSQEFNKVKLFFDSFTSSGNESLVLRFGPEPISFFIDNLKVSKVTTKMNRDRIFFRFNSSGKEVNYSLSGSFKDGKGQQFEDSVTIPPYNSVLLFRID